MKTKNFKSEWRKLCQIQATKTMDSIFSLRVNARSPHNNKLTTIPVKIQSENKGASEDGEIEKI